MNMSGLKMIAVLAALALALGACGGEEAAGGQAESPAAPADSPAPGPADPAAVPADEPADQTGGEPAGGDAAPEPDAEGADETVPPYTLPDSSYEAVEVIAEPAAIDVLVNKKYALPRDYVPDDLVEPDVPFIFEEKLEKRKLRKEAAEALEALFAAAKEDGILLAGVSGYRSYATQKSLYNWYVKRDGQEAADRYSARPGHSEHSTGLAIDVSGIDGKCAATDCFADTPEAKWLAENVYDYGFIIRYPEGKEHITGYKYEPWHLRYVGVETAREIRDLGVTLEEYVAMRQAAAAGGKPAGSDRTSVPESAATAGDTAGPGSSAGSGQTAPPGESPAPGQSAPTDPPEASERPAAHAPSALSGQGAADEAPAPADDSPGRDAPAGEEAAAGKAEGRRADADGPEGADDAGSPEPPAETGHGYGRAATQDGHRRA